MHWETRVEFAHLRKGHRIERFQLVGSGHGTPKGRHHRNQVGCRQVSPTPRTDKPRANVVSPDDGEPGLFVQEADGLAGEPEAALSLGQVRRRLQREDALSGDGEAGFAGHQRQHFRELERQDAFLVHFATAGVTGAPADNSKLSGGRRLVHLRFSCDRARSDAGRTQELRIGRRLVR